MAHIHAHRSSHQLLFGDIHLEVAIWVGLGEFFGKGRVAYFTIQANDIRIGSAQCHQRISVGFARGNCFFTIVFRQFHCFFRRFLGRFEIVGLLNGEGHTAHVVEFFQRLFFLLIVEGLAMPAIFIFQEGDALAFYRFGNNQCGRAIRLHSLRESTVDFLVVVAVNNDCIPAKGFGTCFVDFGVPAVHGFAALPQAVDVENTHQVVEFVIRGMIKCLPDRAFSHLAVAKQDPDVIR